MPATGWSQSWNQCTNRRENVNPLCLCWNWFQCWRIKAVVWENNSNAFSNAVIKSSIHPSWSGIYGQIFEHSPKMKNVQYIKISIIKTSGKMSKQQWPCSSQRTVLFKENRTSAQTKEDCFSCLGRFSNQKMHLKCQWNPGLSLAANTNVECFSGVTEPLLHHHATYSTKAGKEELYFQSWGHFWLYLLSRKWWGNLWRKSCTTCH